MQTGEWNIEQSGGLLDLMTEDQLKGWLEFYEVEPFGEDRADIRSGVAASGIANVVIASQGGKQRLKAEVFMPNFEKASKRKPLKDPKDWKGFTSALRSGLIAGNAR